MNVVLLHGVLSRTAERRALPSGSSLVAYEVTTRDGDTTCTVPVVWFDGPGSAELEAGTEVVVVGSVRRRFFRAGGATASRTEVVATQVVPARQRKRVRSLADEVVARVSGM
jgi:single-strand DNA-binding protein